MKYRKYDTKCCTHIMSLIAKPNCALLEFEVMAARTVSRGLKRTRRKKSFREKILPLSFLLVFVLPFFLFLCLYVIRHVGKSCQRSPPRRKQIGEAGGTRCFMPTLHSRTPPPHYRQTRSAQRVLEPPPPVVWSR